MVTPKPLNLSLMSISTVPSHGQALHGYLNAKKNRTHITKNIHRNRLILPIFINKVSVYIALGRKTRGCSETL